MDTLDLSAEEMHQIFLIGQRLLINESTHPDDLKGVLVQRLKERRPRLAGKIGGMGRPQMTKLCRAILAQQQSFA
jgi:hypothetical protein